MPVEIDQLAEAAAECMRLVGRDAGPDAATELARNALEVLAAADDIA